MVPAGGRGRGVRSVSGDVQGWTPEAGPKKLWGGAGGAAAPEGASQSVRPRKPSGRSGQASSVRCDFQGTRGGRAGQPVDHEPTSVRTLALRGKQFSNLCNLASPMCTSFQVERAPLGGCDLRALVPVPDCCASGILASWPALCCHLFCCNEVGACSFCS